MKLKLGVGRKNGKYHQVLRKKKGIILDFRQLNVCCSLLSRNLKKMLSMEGNCLVSILRKSISGRHRPVSYPDVDLRRMLAGTCTDEILCTSGMNLNLHLVHARRHLFAWCGPYTFATILPHTEKFYTFI